MDVTSLMSTDSLMEAEIHIATRCQGADGTAEVPQEFLNVSIAGSAVDIDGESAAHCCSADSFCSDSNMLDSPQQNTVQSLEILAQAAAVAQGSKCWMCLEEPTDGCRACPECSKSVCLTCASISNGLLDAVRPFSKGGEPDAAWQELHCLDCQTVEEYDKRLLKCLEHVELAIGESLKQNKKTSAPPRCKMLWHHVGLAFVEGVPFSGVLLPFGLCERVTEMVKIECQCRASKYTPSVGPWDAVLVGLPPEVVLSVSRCYARQSTLRASAVLKEIGDSQPIILFVSPDLGAHPTAHLMAAELMEMAKSDRAVVWVLCVAKPDRLTQLESDPTYRKALQQSYGAKILALGHLTDKQIAERVSEIGAQIIYLAGFHQDADRIAMLEGVTGAVIVQAVAHASTTGSSGVDYVLCSRTVLPEKNRKHFSEKPLYIEGPFLPNSFSYFFSKYSDRLKQLRDDAAVRSEARKKFDLPVDGKLILNIAQPNRLREPFFDMVFEVLRANPNAFLVLIDHNFPAFKRRMEARFKTKGLPDRILFVPFQPLQSGELHEFLALGDIYLDTPVYNGHTAAHEALWANGVFVTVKGNSLASMVGADLLEWFGTPENVCASVDDAVGRVNSLLQAPELLAQARLNAEQCRAKSLMYDNAHRAKIVIEALLRAYTDKLSEQRKKQASSASARLLLDTDLQPLTDSMHSLGIEVQGSAVINELVSTIPATFRGVEVEIKIANQLDARPEDNVLYLELLGRDWHSVEYGCHVWPQLLPLVETRNPGPGGDPELDVITLSIRGRKAYAVIEERQAFPAGELLDALAEGWKVKPSEITVKRTAGFLLAMVKLLGSVQARGRSHGGEPRDFKLSHLQDGYGKKAMTYVEHSDGQVYALLLGGAEGLMDPAVLHHHLSDCRHVAQNQSNAETQRRQRTRGQNFLAVSRATPARTSARITGNNACISAAEIRSMLCLPSPSSCSCIKNAKRMDLRRAATAVVNAILGKTGQKTIVVESEWEGCTAHALCIRWLNGLSSEELEQATGLHRVQDVDDPLCIHVMRQTQQHEALFKLLAKMLGGAELAAAEILASNPFPGMALPSKAYPEGLESAPEDLRQGMRTEFVRLTRRLSPATQHYYVAGCTMEWRNETRKLIATWLVITWNEDKKRYYRSVLAAERGAAGDLGAIYDTRIEPNEALATHLDVCYFLKIPSCAQVMDGKPRSINAVPEAVAHRKVAQFVNSILNELNVATHDPNCTRDWKPDWNRLGAERTVFGLPEDLAMGLKLSGPVQIYDELRYQYNWGKSEEKSGKATATKIQTDLLAAMNQSGARRTRR